MSRLGRLLVIERVFVKYALDELLFAASPRPAVRPLRHLFLLSPTRWLSDATRKLPRGQRIRLALEELGPVFVKLGQMLSTRRDILPDDIGDELSKLQDQVAPFPSAAARAEVEAALGKPVAELFQHFEDVPIASASVAQVHGVTLHDGQDAIVKVLRPGIRSTIERDVGLMYLLAGFAARVLSDGRRLHPREVVAEHERTLQGELDLVAEATNAVVLRNNFKGSRLLYIPEIFWEFTRTTVLVQERIAGIPIRDVDAMRANGMDMKKLAEHGVEIFYTQVFDHNFFHADMHPGNIFVSRETPEHPQYIAVDFGIVGSLTDEDQRYIGENLLAFLQRDYRRVAQLHIDSGWVPPYTRVSELEAGIRAVCEPIFEKPLSEISFGDVLVQLFHVARRFEMEVQPQLVLLQKTLLNIEGLGRQLYPELDLWATGKPFLKRWVMERNHPRHVVKQLIEQAPEIMKALPEMPMLVHDFLKLQNQQAAGQPFGSATADSRAPAWTSRQVPAGDRSLRYTLLGAALIVAAALVLAARTVSEGVDGPGLFGWALGLGGALAMWRGFRR